MDYLLELVARFLAAVIVLTLHEFARAFVAWKCGDPTAKFSGRMSLNPMRHFDPLGMLLFALAGFGWAKPVPVNPGNFKKYRSGCFWTSAAGVIVNYLSAFLFYPLYMLVFTYFLGDTYGHLLVGSFVLYLYVCSLSFCVFNLLPLYPLDGFRIVDALNRKRGKVYRFLRNYGYYILLGLIALDILADYVWILEYINILGYLMTFATNILGWPIRALWSLVF